VEVPHPPAAVGGKTNDLKPRGALPGYALEELLPRMSVNVAVKYLGPVCEVREDHRRDLAVVGDQVALGVALLQPEDLAEVGQDELVVSGEAGVYREYRALRLCPPPAVRSLDFRSH
jgi:hypothetical protein